MGLKVNGGIPDIIDVSRVTLIWTVQNVIDSEDQMKFKVLLDTSSRIPAPRWGAIQVPRNEKR